MASGPPEMIPCGWRDCSSWFSTGVDMNQHVLINHIKFMKVKFGEVDSAVVEARNEEKPKPREDSSRNKEFPPTTPVLSKWIADNERMISQSRIRTPTTPPKPQMRFEDSRFQAMEEERKEPFIHYYDVEEDEDDPEAVDFAPASANPSEVSQVPEEPSSRKRSSGDVEDDFEYDDFGRAGSSVSQQSAKKAKLKSMGSEKRPWALKTDMSHIPPTDVRLNTSYPSMASMAHAIREELTCRKTLRKKHPANGNYCVVCLDYRKDNGFCEYVHNNQHDFFVKFWHKMFGEVRINKQNLLLQLLEMQKLHDALPAIEKYDPCASTSR